MFAAALIATSASQVASFGADPVPLLLGNWADPTIVRSGDDYYMTHSSFAFQPGLLVWHSKDLRRWRPISRAVTNQPGSIWAPDLIEHDGTFYLYYPAAGGNFVVTAEDPRGPWSRPVKHAIGGIDPGHIATPGGERYLWVSGGRFARLSADGLRVTTKSQRGYAGWPIPSDWVIECMCLESPKLLRRGEWYYMTSAQGGTAGVATSHMVVAARSKTPTGPWENAPHNPIIRTHDRGDRWWSKGHGTVLEGPGGQWYCVYHAWMNGQRSLGRCTLIEPIEWTPDGWYRAAEEFPDGWQRPVEVDMPMSDEFDGDELGIQWQFWEHFDAARFALKDGALELSGYGDDVGSSRPLCVMPLHTAYAVETELEVDDGVTAGLTLFFNEEVHLGYGLGSDGKVRRIGAGFRRYGGDREPDIRGRRRVALRIVNDRQDVSFFYRDAEGRWQYLPTAIDVSGAQHNALGGWHTIRPALFATGKGKARFLWFKYRALDRPRR